MTEVTQNFLATLRTFCERCEDPENTGLVMKPDVLMAILNHIEKLKTIAICTHLDTVKLPAEDEQVTEVCQDCGAMLWTGLVKTEDNT